MIVADSTAAEVMPGLASELVSSTYDELVNTRYVKEVALLDGSVTSVGVRRLERDGDVIGLLVEFHPGGISSGDRSIHSNSVRVRHQTSTFQRALSEATRIAAFADFLVTGEPGVGKLTLARAVHTLSGDPARIEVLEAYAAHSDPAEWAQHFEHAIRNADTLVLRHVDQLPTMTAGWLATVLERRSTITPWPRLIATSLGVEPLDVTVAALLARLGVYRVDLPALRHRPDELPGLLRTISEQLGSPAVRWSKAAIEMLARAEWHGNVTELKALAARVLRNRTTGLLTEVDIPREIREQASGRQLSRLERIGREAIVAALQECDGNKVSAAVNLGIARSSLYRKLHLYKIEPGLRPG